MQSSLPPQLPASISHLPRLPLGYRITAGALSALLFLTSSPPLLAISIGQIRAGSATPGAGGQGSYSNLQNAGAASAALTAAMAQGNLKKANDIITAMRQVQAEARNAATGKLPNGFSIPNGLKPGGLEVYNPSGQVTASGNVPITWRGVSSLTETRANASDSAAATVNVTQGQQSAYLYWNKFNVGPQTTLNFHLAENLKANPGQNIAFNKVMSPSSPSHIFGKINAEGQVYILNQNGILFHNGSAVNTRSLVASTLPINKNLAGDHLDGVTGAGIVNYPASASGKTPAQFLFTALDRSSYDPTGKNSAVTSVGDVVVEKGADISASQDGSGSGGLVALIGANVANDGVISTPSGQSILAAGLQVALTPHPSSDPSLRGLDVTIGAVTDPRGLVSPISGSAGLVLNGVFGIISARQGGIAMAGSTVRQNGALDLTTSVAFNGRIDLQANYGARINPNYIPGTSYFFYNSTGSVEIGTESVLRILPEWDSAVTINGNTLALNSLIHVLGRDISIAGGGMILAPGAISTIASLSMTGSLLGNGVTIQAGEWIGYDFAATTGTISLQSGSVIDVSGSTGIEVDGAQNFLGIDPKNSLQLRGAELADSPLQRTSAVRGKNIVVDIRNTGSFNGRYWMGTPLGDVTGYAALIQKKVGQLTLNGGSVGISAGHSVDISPGASVNVSGGWANFLGGYRGTSRLITADGRYVEIAEATPDQVYTSLISGPVRYDPSYFYGGAGGKLSVTAPVITPNGSLHGTTVNGFYQLRGFGHSSTPASPTAGSSLALNFYGQSAASALANASAVVPPVVTLGSWGLSVAESVFLPESILSNKGFGNLSVNNHDGTILVPRHSAISAPIDASISLMAARIDIDGTISAPSGSISLEANLIPYDLRYGISRFPFPNESLLGVLTDASGHHFAQYGSASVLDSSGNVRPMPLGLSALKAGIFTLGSRGILDVSGTRGSDFPTSLQPWQPSSVKGGEVSVNSYSMQLERGSVIDVSGGVLVANKGSLVYGEGGAIRLAGGQEPEAFRPTIRSGIVSLNSTLLGYGGWGMAGGNLTIAAPAIRIGGNDPGAGFTWIRNSFFDGVSTSGMLDQAGFSGFSFQGLGSGDGTEVVVPGIHVASGLISPVVRSRMVSGTAGDLKSITMPRNMAFPASISLSAESLTDTTLSVPLLRVRGDAVIDAGATIKLNPGLFYSSGSYLGRAGVFSVSGGTVAVEGSIIVPGGSITVQGENTLLSNDFSQPLPGITVNLGPQSTLNAGGIFLTSDAVTAFYRPAASVLSGGTITVLGNILAEDSSMIDVRGSSGMVDLFGNAGPKTVRVDTAGGKILVSGGEMMSLDSRLVAISGGPTAHNGTLVIDSGRFYSLSDSSLRLINQINTSLILTGVDQNGNQILTSAKPTLFSFADRTKTGPAPSSGRGAIGSLVSWGDEIKGGGRIRAETIDFGNFSSVNLRGNISVRGGVEISADSSIVIASSHTDPLGVVTGGILAMSSFGGASSLALNAPYVRLGRDFKAPVAPGDFAYKAIFGAGADPIYVAPTGGPGLLQINSSVTDFGNISLQGLSRAVVEASSAVRGNGTVDIAGDLFVESPVIYPSSGTQFTLVAYNRDRSGTATSAVANNDSILPGTVTLTRTGTTSVPLSAGGTLSIYASTISQGGALIAPFGRINLGWDSSAKQPGDPLTGAGAFNAGSPVLSSLPSLKHLTLSGGMKPDHSDGSITSVSATDPLDSRRSVSVPFGKSYDGKTWISPSGADITSTGVLLAADGTSLSKGISINVGSLVSQEGSLLDLVGGGDFFSLRWVSGLQGTINHLAVGSSIPNWSPVSYEQGDLVNDGGFTWSARQSDPSANHPIVGPYWTKLASSFAILPGYSLPVAPDGYGLEPAVGSSFNLLSPSLGLAAGNYVLLPSVFATLPGAYLVSSLDTTPGAATIPITQVDGSSFVRGYVFDGLDQSLEATSVSYQFQLRTSHQVMSKYAQYDRNFASDQFVSTDSNPENGSGLGLSVSDSAMLKGAINGNVTSRRGVKSRIDINYAGGIQISKNGVSGMLGDLKLSSEVISSWNFGSLLVGGKRSQRIDSGTTAVITATTVSLDSEANLSGSEIILAAKNLVKIGEGAHLSSTGSEASPDPVIRLFGEGALVRVSGDRDAMVVRSHSKGDGSTDLLFGTSGGNLMIDGNSSIDGLAVVLDSTGTANLIAPTASLFSDNTLLMNISSRVIDLDFDKDVSGSPGAGITIGKSLLASLGSIDRISFSSYSAIALLGDGAFGDDESALEFHAGTILSDGGQVVISSSSILLDNARGAAGGGSIDPSAGFGSIVINSGALSLGDGALVIGGMSDLTVNLSGGMNFAARGSIEVNGDMALALPAVTVAAGSDYAMAVSGALTLDSVGTQASSLSGIGGTLKLSAESLAVGAPIMAPGGTVTLSSDGDLSVAATVSTRGSSAVLGSATRDYDAGSIILNSRNGDILLRSSALLDVSSDSSGAAGRISIAAPFGSLRFSPSSATMQGGSQGGLPGSFTMDVSSLNRESPDSANDLSALENKLTSANLILSQDIRIRSGDVFLDSWATARSYDYSLKADTGSVQIAGKIDASGKTITDPIGKTARIGGSIKLEASGSIQIDSGAILDARGDTYDNAGKGGAVYLSAGAEVNGVIDETAQLILEDESLIDLSISASPKSIQDLGGVLHLRAPIIGSDIRIEPLKGLVSGASSVVVEGYRLYQVDGTSEEIDSELRDSIAFNASQFFGSAGNAEIAREIRNRIARFQPDDIKGIMNLAPGVEIINQSGDLILAPLSDWDFSTLRFGANHVPGFLSLRASGNITLKSSLSDGFQPFDSMGNALPSGADFRAVLMPLNQQTPRNFQSWDFRVTAGADFGSVSLLGVNNLSSRDINLGVTAQDGIPTKSGVSISPDGQGENATTLTAITDGILLFGQDASYNAFQSIRTGTGDIQLSASGNFQLWNQFSTVYTAGAVAPAQDMDGAFDLPTAPSRFIEAMNRFGQTSYLGVAQQDNDGIFNPPPYVPQYAAWGGNLSVQVSKDMQQLTYDNRGAVIQDSVSQMPSNWLYRRGAVNSDGSFVKSGPEILSTTWWIDYSNFFDGVATLGGGNLTLFAGGSIRNINASLPTNFRMDGDNASSSTAIELGGGDLRVITGGDLDAGVYYVERGVGNLKVGGAVTTNKTRSINRPDVTGTASSYKEAYLPATFFMGKGGLNLQANGDITLGSVVNPFLTPQGINNGYWYRNYFSTYAQSDWVKVSSIGGNITFRNAGSSPGGVEATPLLLQWFNSFTAPAAINNNISSYQPWARLAVTTVSLADFGHALTYNPPTLGVVSFGGSIIMQGGFDLAPSASGNLSLAAADSVIGLANGGGRWISASINVSDASPDSIPSAIRPAAQVSVIGTSAGEINYIQDLDSSLSLFSSINGALSESGSYYGAASLLSRKLALHDQTILHKADSQPTVISAAQGDIAGLTLYSPVSSKITAGGEISDISFFIQNVRASDISVVSSSGDMTLFDPQSKRIQFAQNSIPSERVPVLGGDLQISGPGTLEVLAGGNLDMGRNPKSGDPSVNNGITSIGNSRNPGLESRGADLFISAGVPLPSGVASYDQLGSFAQWALSSPNSERYLSELSSLMRYTGNPVPSPLTSDLFLSDDGGLSPGKRALLNMDLFYLVLRDAGRDRSDPEASGYGSYAAAEKAISLLLDDVFSKGDISTWSQSITTVNGGDISLFVPGGGIDMGAISYKGSTKVAPGIITQGGGNVDIYVRNSLSIGINRVFTLKGGNILIWSDKGDIAAGASSKSVQSAPPTQVLVHPLSANIEVNLAGLATGGGIGVLASLAGVAPGDVDLIAVSGVIDAGDAGIRSSGNLRLSATKILNADNIVAAGIVVGAPPAAAPASAPAVAAPPVSAPAGAGAAAAAANNAAEKTADKGNATNQDDATPSVFSIDIMGYGGGEGDDDDSRKKAADTAVAPVQASL